MTRKHFIALAASIKAAKQVEGCHDNTPAEAVRRFIAFDVADVCATTNANFDRARFLAACDVA